MNTSSCLVNSIFIRFVPANTTVMKKSVLSADNIMVFKTVNLERPQRQDVKRSWISKILEIINYIKKSLKI